MNKRIRNGLETVLAAIIVIAIIGMFLGTVAGIAAISFFAMDTFGPVGGVVVLAFIFFLFAFLMGYFGLPKDD